MKSNDAARAGIYRIRVTRPHKGDRVYIGQAINLRHRLKIHRATLKRGRHHNRALQGAYKKYGEEAFSYEILVVCPTDPYLLTLLEQRILNYHAVAGPVYNICIECVSSPLGVLHSADVRKKMSLDRKGRKMPADAVELIRQATIKRYEDPLERKKVGDRMRGNKHNVGRVAGPETRAAIAKKATGRSHSQETKDLLSSMLKGRALLPETCAKMSASRMGMKRGPFSEEHKQKLSDALKGKPITYVREPPSEETRLKISNTLKGKPLSAETKLKMSISHRARLSALAGT